MYLFNFKKNLSLLLAFTFFSINCINYDINLKDNRYIFRNNSSYAIEPITASIIATVLASLALSLGFRLVDSTSDSFTQGCMTLYENFSTNLKNLIDRIAGERQAGSSTFDISPEEMQMFADELSSLINQDPNAVYPFDDTLSPTGDNSNVFKTYYGTEFKYDTKFEIGVRYKFLAEVYNLDGTVKAQKIAYIQFNSDLKYDFYADAVTTNKLGSGFTSHKPSVVYNYGNSIYYPAPTSVFALALGSYQGFIIPKARVVIGDEIVKVEAILPTNINTTDLISELVSSGALNGQGNITQNFITNTDTAVPSDSYVDVRAKTAIDSLYDGADTNVPDVPQDWGIIRSLYDVLEKIYNAVKTGIASLYNLLSQIYSWLMSLPNTLTTWLEYVFVPQAGFMNPIINNLQVLIGEKIGNGNKIDLSAFAVSRIPEDININIMGVNVTIFKAQPLIYIVDSVRGWIIGFLSLLAVFYNYNNVYRLFNSKNYTKAMKGR